MATNAQKIPTAQSLNNFAKTRNRNSIQLLGKALPCSVTAVNGAIITVKFEVSDAPFTFPPVSMPLFGPEYIRYPIQVGDKGMAVPADAYLGQMSGLGPGVADLTQRGNLSQLAFLPLGNKHWSAVDGQAVTLYGPNGVVLRDTSNAASVVLTPTSITLTCGGHSIVISSAGVTIDGRVFLTHTHTGVTTGAGHTGVVV